MAIKRKASSNLKEGKSPTKRVTKPPAVVITRKTAVTARGKTSSPKKQHSIATEPIQAPSPEPPFIPSQQCLNAQKREILRNIQNPADLVDEEASNSIALKQLSDLLSGTVIRGEGNSCLVLGPRGSGKTRVSLILPYLARLITRGRSWTNAYPTSRNSLLFFDCVGGLSSPTDWLCVRLHTS